MQDKIIEDMLVELGSKTSGKSLLLAPETPLSLQAGSWAELKRELMAFSRVRHYDSGQHVFLEGQDFLYCYYIFRGMVRLFHRNEDGRENTLSFVIAPNLFAEGLLFHEQKEYPVTALVLEAASCLMIEQEALHRIALRYKDLHLALSHSMAQKLNHLNTRVRGLLTENLEQRLSEYLYLEHRRQKSPQIRLPVQKKHLAMYLGTSPETLSRLLAQLQKRGSISMRGKQIFLGQSFLALFQGFE